LDEIITWPARTLTPQSSPFDLRPFSRSGGRTLGGVSRSVRTDRGYWSGSYNNIVFRRSDFDQQRTWNALSVALAGMTGLIAVPVCSTALWAGLGVSRFGVMVPHGDGTPHSDGSLYRQNSIDLVMSSAAQIGQTVVTLRLLDLPTPTGIRFSYRHGMYQTGRVLAELSGGRFQVEVFPAIRAPIPAGAPLETEFPTVLCHLASDGEMDIDMGLTRTPRPSVRFVEAVDYWNDLALGLL